MYDSKVRYDSVFVVQSLAANEDPTGAKLFDGTIAPQAASDHLVAVLYDNVVTKRDLLSVLNAIAEEAEEHGRSPILHLEAHGGLEGIRVADPAAELVRWEEVAPFLLRINRASRMNLLVVAGMCHGVNLVDVLDPLDRAPAFGIIGAPERVSPEALLDAMRLLYWNLLNDQGINLTLSAMRSEGRGDFRMVSAELWLCQVFRASLEADNETREQRVARLLQETFKGAIPDVRESMARRVEIARELDDNRKWFDYYRQTFLWLDQFPENEERFRFTYEQCMAVAAS